MPSEIPLAEVDEKHTPYRSPKSITPEMMDEVLRRSCNLESKHCADEWIRATESKEFFRMMAYGKDNDMRSIFILGLQLGFDLHAAYGDAGRAVLYIPTNGRMKEEKNEPTR